MQNLTFISLIMLTVLSGCDHLKEDVKSVEAGYQASASDTVIYTSVIQVLQNTRRDLPSDTRVIVLKGRVLLVGYVNNAKEHIDLINALWQIKGVKEVIDHLESVPENEKTGFSMKQAFLKTQLDTKFLANSQLKYGRFQYVLFKDNLYVLSSSGQSVQKDAFFAMVRQLPTIQKVFFYDVSSQ